jgi:hypothetical protein
MSRPTKFEEFRYVGDKRNQRFYDLDDLDLIRDHGGAHGPERPPAWPDTPAEARNRGYRAAR